MTLPEVKVDQAWRRADDTTVLIERSSPFGFFAAGTYYTGGQHNDRYYSPGGNPSLDLVALIQPLVDDSTTVLPAVAPKEHPLFVDTPEDGGAWYPEESCPPRLETLGYNNGVFCGLDEDGGAWYLRENATEWIKLPSLPSE